MREFWIYTGMRLGLFVASLILVIGVWSLLSDTVNGLLAAVLALAISGVASYFLLNPQREALARRVQERAGQANAAFEERRAREDTD